MADYSQVYINNDMSKLNTVLQTLVTNGIVGAVDYDSSGTYAVFKIYADAEKTTEVFRITQSVGQNPCVKYTFKATASDESTLESTASVTTNNASQINGYLFRYGYACANGVMLSILPVSVNIGAFSYVYMWLMITRNQEGAPVFIWTNNTATSAPTNGDQILTNINTEYIVAASDVAPLDTVSRTMPSARNQAVLTPFFTCCDANAVSYTPNAGRFLACDLHRFIYNSMAHEITFDGAIWLTNGYWVLKVGDAA